MALPDGHEEKTKDQWLELATSGDSADRKQVSKCLIDLGYDPPMFLGWSAADRVAKLMEHQDGAGGGSSKKSSSKKSSTKGANKKKASTTSTASTTEAAATVDLSEVTDGLEALSTKVQELGEALDISMDYTRELHTMMRVFFQSDEQAKNNLEELGNYFHGKLLGLEEEESEEED